MRDVKIILLSVFISVAAGTGVCWYAGSNPKKIAVVDAVRLFNGFAMSREMEAQEKRRLEDLSARLDSISNVLKMAQGTRKSEGEIKQLAYGYKLMKERLENEYSESNRAINTAVWKRLNPLLAAYGKEKKLNIIIGANGMGSVLFVDEYCDITEDVNNYINKRYAEGN
ncbi:MAG: OmpH family outer membrane protein [Bacteroidota bacterium]